MDYAGEILRRGSFLPLEGQLADDIEQVRAALLGDPESGSLWKKLGLLFHRAADYWAARNALELASSLVPLDHDCLLALASSYAHAGQEGPAADLYRQVLEDGKTPVELLSAIASGLGALGAFEDALRACRELVRREPGCHEAHFGIAFYLRKLGHPCEAIYPMVSRAHELAPNIPLYRITLSSLLAHAGRWEEAHELIEDINPRSVGCRCCLRRMMSIFIQAGDVSLAGRFQERIEQLTGAATRRPLSDSPPGD